MNGRLSLRVGLRDGYSTLIEAECHFPLQVLRPQRRCDGGLELVVLTPSGGLLEGDDLQVEVVVEAGAHLALRTQAATQVHRGRSSQSWSISVGEGATFSYMPHALVPHESAIHHTCMNAVLAQDARLFLAEIVSPGRAHRGELFTYRELRSDLDVWQDGRLVARERQLLQPANGLVPQQLGGHTHYASAYVFGPELPPLPDVPLLGVSELASGGHCLRALGSRSCDLEALLTDLLAGWERGARPFMVPEGVRVLDGI